MIVVCFYAENAGRRVPGLREKTARALAYRSPVPAEFVDVSGSDEAYWAALHEAWGRAYTERDDLVVVEHDVVVRRSCFDTFETCFNPWCGYAYELAGGTQMALGFTRFRLELIDDLPDAVELAGEPADDGVPRRHWVRMDTRIDRVLREHGYSPCEHRPPVRHLNERQREVRVA